MIAGLLSRYPPRVLLDLREGDGIHGLHLAASVSHLVSRGTPAELWALHEDAGDVELELTLLRQESGQLMQRWKPDVRGIRFDLLVAMADDVPLGVTWASARRTARRTLLGLMFPDATRRVEPDIAITGGHDTVAFADRLEQELRRPRSRSFFWRQQAS